MDREETIKFLEEKLTVYEDMRDSYISQMDSLNLKMSCIPEGLHKRDLTKTYENQAEGLRGIISYITALKERLEAIKNDPNYDDECKYTL